MRDRRALLAAVEALRGLCGEAEDVLADVLSAFSDDIALVRGRRIDRWKDLQARLRAAARQPEGKA